MGARSLVKRKRASKALTGPIWEAGANGHQTEATNLRRPKLVPLGRLELGRASKKPIDS
jgi:hypothetical protein